jgi:hypothetical protein
MEKKGNAYAILTEKPEGRRQLDRHRRQWKNTNIKMDLQELGWDSVDWINLA